MTNIHSPEYKYLLKKLLEARNAAGLTQVQVAERLDKPQSYVSKCESGERRLDVTELNLFAKIYNKPLDFFTQE